MERVVTPEGRRYVIPGTDETYESVTTALGKNPEKQKGLQEWRNRIGEEEANRISRVAAYRGTRFHTLTEKFLNGENEAVLLQNELPGVIEMFLSIKPILQKNIQHIYMQEAFLFSHKYKLAGAVDCIAQCDGKLCVIDFKTSGKIKRKDWIADYFLQCSAYSFMFEEMYGDKIDNIIVLIAIENNKPQFFVEEPIRFKQDKFFTSRIRESEYA